MKDFLQWRENLCVEQKPAPGVFVIFGASGDLAKRKLFPSLYALFQRGLLDARSRIVGCARSEYSDAAFRAHLSGFLDGGAGEFLSRVSYIQLDYDAPDAYPALAAHLDSCDAEACPLSRVFYLALPSGVYPGVVRNLARARMLEEHCGACWRHVVFEKPFGTDFASAAALDAELHKVLSEKQIYRIDHYLGKETVQNIFLLRFANLIFEPIWNAHYIDNVQITVAESLGVEARGGYFDGTGLLRDMFQNHMLEMLALAAMECPREFSADAVRDEKVKLIKSIRRFDPRSVAEVVRGQYNGYRNEEKVAPDSETESFVALRLFIDSWRWKGVPFYLRAGKKLGGRRSEIDVVFKSVPHSIFPRMRSRDFQQDVLHLRVQPAEGMGLTLQAKKPGPKLCMGALTLNYDYATSGGAPLDAYARLLLDCALGDQTLFIRSDVIAAAWQLYGPVLDYWRSGRAAPLETYDPGSNGPAGADELLARDGRKWEDEALFGI